MKTNPRPEAHSALVERGPAEAVVRQTEAQPVIEPLAYRKAAVARMLGGSVRTIERLLSAGKFPRPDAYLGKCPLWTRETLTRWIAQGRGRI